MNFPNNLKELAAMSIVPNIELSEKKSADGNYRCYIAIRNKRLSMTFEDFTDPNNFVANFYGYPSIRDIPDDLFSKTDFTFEELCKDAFKKLSDFTLQFKPVSDI